MDLMPFQHRVQKCMRAEVSPSERVLFAISGGPDSVALAHLLKNLSWTIVLGHVDHQLRPGSGRDARFVDDLAKRWSLPCRVERVTVPPHAASRRQGIEEAARDLRYKALIKMARRAGCRVIVTAHTADDQAETVLMNFLRGAGPAGMAGIPPVRQLTPGVRVVRPLLDATRRDVLAYLKQHRLASRQDPSNRSPRFTRNRIRRQLLPLLEKEYPGLRQRLVQMSEIFREEQGLWAGKIQREYDKTVRQNNKKITVDLPRLLGYHKALGRRILRHFLTGISFQDTERVFQWAQSSRPHPLHLSSGLQVERKGTELIITS
jgi:tRNA(Ile)-lysidine synthase